MKPSRRSRLFVALGVGLLSALVTYVHLAVLEKGLYAFDFTWPWRAARYLLAGQNPYIAIHPSGPFPLDANFKYPLPAALIAIPFAWFSPPFAAAAFSGVSSAALAFGLAANGYGRLFILLSAPNMVAIMSAQWSSILMAAALLPTLGWMAICKPTVGGAAFMSAPRWRNVAIMAMLAGASWAWIPTWFTDWLTAIRTDPFHHYLAPASLWGGPILLLAALRWRRPEARWLLVLSLAPQALTFYSGFPPMLVAETKREALILSVSSTIAWVIWDPFLGRPEVETQPYYAGYWMLVFIFLPALIIVLRRPNEGPAPVWIGRIVSQAPVWLRGRATQMTS